MYKIILSLLIISSNLCSYAQEHNKIIDYHSEIYRGDLMAKRGSLDSAIVQYEKYFEQVNFVHTYQLLHILEFAKKTKDRKRIKYYRNRIKAQTKCPKENKFLKTVVDSVLKVDQKYISGKFYDAHLYVAKCHDDSLCDTTSPKYIESFVLKTERDEVMKSNIDFLLGLIKVHGFLGVEQLGEEGAWRFLVPILHYDYLEDNKRLRPILKEALKNNRIDPMEYAVVYDRHLFGTKGIQKFWTSPYGCINPKLSENELKDVLKLRESIGIFGSTLKFGINKSGEWQAFNTYSSYY